MLPEALTRLTEREKADLLSRPALPFNISQAAEALWNSEYQSLIDLMLVFFYMRPKAWNSIQHPQPSTAFAHGQVASIFVLAPDQDDIIRHIIDEGWRRGEDGEWVLLFDHNTTVNTVG
jgi:hypothetical protein